MKTNITTKPFALDNPSPVGPRNLPVCDVFFCRGKYIALVGPYYSRVGFEHVRIESNGENLPFWHLPDQRFFSMCVLAVLPRQQREKQSWNIKISQAGKVVFEGHISRQVGGPAGRLSMATLTKYDHPYIAEWVEYHCGLGIEHFYIYNNGSPQISAALVPFSEVVTEIAWPGGYGSESAFWEPFWSETSHFYTQPVQNIHAVLKYGDNWDWMGFFDADEFLCPMQDNSLGSITDAWERGRYSELVHQYTGAVRVQGKWFGTSAHRGLPDGSILKNYLRCEAGHTCGTKSFVRPEAVNSSAVHYFDVIGQTGWLPDNVLRFNHYRSISSYKKRVGGHFDDEYTNAKSCRRILEVRDSL